MTSPNWQPVNVAGGHSRVGMQGQIDIDTVILPGDVQLTVGPDASPEAKYRAGVENLQSGNPRAARRLIWETMMSGCVNNKVLFHWLVAMLSGRTVRQFSSEEIDQIKRSRSRYAGAGDDAWTDGVRLIYRLFESVLPSLATEAGQRTAETDTSLLFQQFDDLAEEQRNMVQPYLELFLTGPLQDELWRGELRLAESRQLAGDRQGRAWMFFQPVPAQVLLPLPRPERISAADRLGMRTGACLFAAAAVYLGWELLWHGAFLGLLAYVAALAGGVVAAAADLEWRFLTERCRRKDELFRVPNHAAHRPAGDELTDQVDRLFGRYFTRYAPAKTDRKSWEDAAAGLREFHTAEIVAMCRGSGITANEVAWLIRYQVRQLKRRWQNGTLHEYQRQLQPRPGTAPARWTGLAFLALGGGWAIVVLHAYPLGDVAAIASAYLAWRRWLHVNLERRRYAADSGEHAHRQAAIDKEFRRWSEKLAARPRDAEMAVWLGCDRTVLLGMTLTHFQLPRSRLTAHAFLEKPGVAVKRAQIEGGAWRYAGYQLRIFLLAEDGVRQVRASLDFMTGTLTIRERTSYRYDAIVSVRVLRDARGRQTFELRLTAGDPITVRVRDADPDDAQQDQDTKPGEEAQEAAEAEEDTVADATSMTDLLHMLEGVAGEGRDWFRERGWAGTRPGDNGAASR